MFWWTERQLKSNDANTRKRAAEKLGQAGTREALPSVLPLLGDPDWGVRVAAVQALGRLGDATTVAPIAAAIKEAERLPGPEAAAAIRAAAIESLHRLGAAYPAALLDAARDANPKTRETLVEALAGIDAEDVRAYLAAALGDERSQVRQAAARGLGRGGSRQSVDALVAALAHKDPATRRSAAEALGELRAPESVPALAGAASDRDHAARDAAVHALAKVGTPEAARALVALVDAGDRPLQQVAWAALAPLQWTPGNARERALRAVLARDFEAASREGEPGVDYLLMALDERDAPARRQVIDALGRLSGPRPAAGLVAALADSDDSVRRAAIDALVKLGPSALEPLALRLEDRAATVRSAASDVLGRLGEVPGALAPHLSALHGRSIERGGYRFTKIEGEAAVERARQAVDSLRTLLSHAARHLTAQDLEAAEALDDVLAVTEMLEETIELADCREMAAAEIARRA